MKLVTWNIQWGRGVDGRVDLDRIVADARRLADFDILCLQEVDAGFADLAGHDGSDQFADLAARLPGYTVVEGIATDLPGPAGRRRFGNLIACRLPVLQVFRHMLPWPADPAVRSMQRIALEANVDTPMGVLRITTTHLEYYSARQRTAQVERLRELQAQSHEQACRLRPSRGDAGPFEPVPRGLGAILTGDFNYRPESVEHARMQAPQLPGTPAYRDAWALAHPGTPHAPTIGLYDRDQWPGPPFACDFVYVSDNLAARVRALEVDAHSAASDHQPVLLDIDVSA